MMARAVEVMSNGQLKAALRTRRVSTRGKRSELQSRLVAAVSEERLARLVLQRAVRSWLASNAAVQRAAVASGVMRRAVRRWWQPPAQVQPRGNSGQHVEMEMASVVHSDTECGAEGGVVCGVGADATPVGACGVVGRSAAVGLDDDYLQSQKCSGVPSMVSGNGDTSASGDGDVAVQFDRGEGCTRSVLLQRVVLAWQEQVRWGRLNAQLLAEWASLEQRRRLQAMRFRAWPKRGYTWTRVIESHEWGIVVADSYGRTRVWRTPDGTSSRHASVRAPGAASDANSGDGAAGGAVRGGAQSKSEASSVDGAAGGAVLSGAQGKSEGARMEGAKMGENAAKDEAGETGANAGTSAMAGEARSVDSAAGGAVRGGAQCTSKATSANGDASGVVHGARDTSKLSRGGGVTSTTLRADHVLAHQDAAAERSAVAAVAVEAESDADGCAASVAAGVSGKSQVVSGDGEMLGEARGVGEADVIQKASGDSTMPVHERGGGALCATEPMLDVADCSGMAVGQAAKCLGKSSGEVSCDGVCELAASGAAVSEVRERTGGEGQRESAARTETSERDMPCEGCTAGDEERDEQRAGAQLVGARGKCELSAEHGDGSCTTDGKPTDVNNKGGRQRSTAAVDADAERGGTYDEVEGGDVGVQDVDERHADANSSHADANSKAGPRDSCAGGVGTLAGKGHGDAEREEGAVFQARCTAGGRMALVGTSQVGEHRAARRELESDLDKSAVDGPGGGHADGVGASAHDEHGDTERDEGTRFGVSDGGDAAERVRMRRAALQYVEAERRAEAGRREKHRGIAAEDQHRRAIDWELADTCGHTQVEWHSEWCATPGAENGHVVLQREVYKQTCRLAAAECQQQDAERLWQMERAVHIHRVAAAKHRKIAEEHELWLHRARMQADQVREAAQQVLSDDELRWMSDAHVAWMDVEQARMDARIDEELSDERAMRILREELFVRAIDAATASAEQAAGEQEERSGADDDPGDAADVMRAARRLRKERRKRRLRAVLEKQERMKIREECELRHAQEVRCCTLSEEMRRQEVRCRTSKRWDRVIEMRRRWAKRRMRERWDRVLEKRKSWERLGRHERLRRVGARRRQNARGRRDIGRMAVRLTRQWRGGPRRVRGMSRVAVGLCSGQPPLGRPPGQGLARGREIKRSPRVEL